eukprot:TRINITY_DN45639_c0_g1_i1.p1 TRINITY_DN45639_c0_g1~~TRINITY_DN45639_c0_g1_i1.p1  ORF type:complete len:110 (+),score=9.90 TRINITY_DN45639_c0_g1_i1:29-331(+)
MLRSLVGSEMCIRDSDITVKLGPCPNGVSLRYQPVLEPPVVRSSAPSPHRGRSPNIHSRVTTKNRNRKSTITHTNNVKAEEIIEINDVESSSTSESFLHH